MTYRRKGSVNPLDSAATTAALATKVTKQSSASAQGWHQNTPSPTYGEWWSIGNAANSAGFAGTGSPADAFGALVIYQKYGTNDGNNTPITKTTQGAYLLTSYYGPTTDDSMEGFSTFVGAKNTGASYTQAKPVTSFEAISQVEGGVTVNSSGYALGVGSRINVLGTGSVTNAYGFKAAVNSSGGPGFGTITNYYGFYQPVTASANGGTVTNKWGVYVADKAQSESALVLAKSGDAMLFKADIAGSGGGSPAFVYAQNPDGTDMATVRLQAITGQTQPLLTAWAQGSSFANATISRLGSFISTAGFVSANSAGTAFFSFDNSGPKWNSATLEQTTIGAAGAASALPATPTKYLKIKDSAGTTLVIPAYAAT